MKFQLTLWDLITQGVQALRPSPAAPSKPAQPRVAQARAAPRKSAAPQVQRRSRVRALVPAPKLEDPAAQQTSMQARYDAITRAMLDKYGIRVRKWRSGMSGIAWYVTYRDGSKQRLIEAPRPKGPMSVAVFLHEIGHHAIGFDVYKPRCLEEYHAWAWAIAAMQANNLNITDAVRHRMHMSLWYAVAKAKRRGIRQVPDELTPFLEKPPRRRRARTS